MKKTYLFLIVCALITWSVTSCKDPIVPEPETPAADTTTVTPADTATATPTDTASVTPVDTTTVTPVDSTAVTPIDTLPPRPESVPRKHLIEEFTGQDCGYCPYGMDCVHDFIANDTNWIVILHHYGYSADHFTVTGSKRITTKLGVSGAPTVAIDRAATKTDDGKNICFHPYYLSSAAKSQFATTTYVSIDINNTYDDASRQLKVKLSGVVCKDEWPELMLTVMVKESGVIDYQQDYYKTYEGWQEFRHTNAVRAFLSAPLGDKVTVDSTTYRWSAEYELNMDGKWLPENCAVVAVLSEAFQPVVQAGQRPVVDGTKGGADILHGGITPVPVADYYPEPGADISPMTYSGREADTLTVANAYYQNVASLGVKYWEIQAYTSNKTVKVNNTSCLPFADIYLFTATSDNSIPAGTYPLNSSLQPGTAYAGFRNDEEMEIAGSSFYYISKSYFQSGYLVPVTQWLVVDGTLTVTESDWKLEGHTRNGNVIRLVGTTAIQNKGRMSAPRRAKSCQSASEPPATPLFMRLASGQH